MKGSTAQVIINALSEKRFQGLLELLAIEAKGEILVKLCNYLRKTDEVSEGEISHALGLTRGKYYHYVELLGAALANFLAGKKEAVQLEQIYQLAGELVTTTAYEAATDLIRAGIKAAMQTEQFELIIRFWDLAEIIPGVAKIEGIDASTAKRLRANLAAFELMLDDLRKVAKNAVATQRKEAVELLLGHDLMQDSSRALSHRATYCFWKIKALGHALLRQYPESIPCQEALLEHIEANAWMFFDPEHHIAKEMSALAVLLRLDLQPEKFRHVSNRFLNTKFLSPRAIQEQSFFKFPTSIVAAIDSGDQKEALDAVQSFRELFQQNPIAYLPTYLSENLYWCLYAAIASKSSEVYVGVFYHLQRMGKHDFKPKIYPMCRFLELIKMIENQEWDHAMRILRSLRVASSLDELEGMREILSFISAQISRWSQAETREIFKLDASSSLKLEQITRGIDLVDYFDLPIWFEAMSKGCPMMDILHHRAISKQPS